MGIENRKGARERVLVRRRGMGSDGGMVRFVSDATASLCSPAARVPGGRAMCPGWKPGPLSGFKPKWPLVTQVFHTRPKKDRSVPESVSESVSESGWKSLSIGFRKVWGPTRNVSTGCTKRQRR